MSVQEFRETAAPVKPAERAGWSREERDAARQRRVARLERRWWGRVCINIFIAWHLFAVAIWLLPNMQMSAIVHAFAPIIRPYMTFTGFMQSWNMFSPNPDNLDVYAEAKITHKDGTVQTWLFPRMVDMDYVKRYQEERWRKFIEVPTHGSYPVLLPAMARYAARVNNTPGNPPVAVALFKCTRTVQPPGVKIGPYQTEPFTNGSQPFTYAVRHRDLR